LLPSANHPHAGFRAILAGVSLGKKIFDPPFPAILSFLAFVGTSDFRFLIREIEGPALPLNLVATVGRRFVAALLSARAPIGNPPVG
jgi:hypothetical protein